MENILKWLTVFNNKQLIIGFFRVFTFFFAIFPVVAFEGDVPHLLPVNVIVAVSLLYTLFKLVHPFRWFSSKISFSVLTAVDLLVIVSLVHITGGLHSPFMLHSFTPVLTASLLRPSRDTLLVGVLTSIYISYAVFFIPQLERVQTIEHVSLASIYLMALASLSILPYTVNIFTSRTLKSAGILEERSRLFRDMHDNLCQTIYGLRWDLKLLRDGNESEATKNKLEELCQLTEDAERQVRDSMRLLGSSLNDFPLLTHFEYHLRELEKKRGIKYRLYAIEEPDLDQSIKYELLRIFQESLRNVEKHSNARNVTVEIRTEDGHLGVIIMDDGQGFDETKSRNHGLTSMSQRAESVGGWLKVYSLPGAGTSVVMDLPRHRLVEPPN